MKRLYYGLATILLATVFQFSIQAQSVGIGTDAPTATLDIVSTNTIPGARITRSLTPTAAPAAAIEINDNSEWGAMDIYYANNSLGFAGAYIENSTPLSMGLWVTNLNASNLTSGRFTQNGNGAGVQIAMLDDAAFGTGLDIFNEGGGLGMRIIQNSATSAAYAMGVLNSSNSQGGLVIDNTTLSAIGITNFLEEGVAVENYHFTETPASIYVDISGFPGLGSSFNNIGYEANLDQSDGNGFYFHNDLLGGNGFGFIGFAETLTPMATPTIYGAIVAGEQYGEGHGILLNHDGVSGRNAEFNIENASNSDPALFVVHEGEGGAMIVQNQKSNISGVIAVIDAAYTGTDNNSDHIGVLGISLPAASRGIGVQGEGNEFGVLSIGDLGSTGAKPFVIDHPLDPENMILKHFALESDKVLNVYQGTVQLDRSGTTVIELPEYFESINVDFSYQLTAIGTPVQPYVSREIEGNTFEVAGRPGSKVSWMVIANRNDAYVRTHPDKVVAEVMKKEGQAGRYLDPVSHGQPRSMGIFYRDRSKDVPASLPERPESQMASKQEKLEKAGLRSGAAEDRTESNIGLDKRPVRPQTRIPIDPVKIRREVQTWDEIH